jgi:hypothetical protein
MTVFDDFLPAKHYDMISKHLLGDQFVWHYNQSSYLTTPVERNGNCIDYPQLIHRVYYDGAVVSQNVYDILLPLINRIAPKKLLRIKCNLNFHDTEMEADCYGFPHIDTIEDGAKTAIFYVNDSDGDTFWFNEPYGIPFDEYTISKRIEPKANRLVVFNSLTMHAGSTPVKSKRRVVINVNYL